MHSIRIKGGRRQSGSSMRESDGVFQFDRHTFTTMTVSVMAVYNSLPDVNGNVRCSLDKTLSVCQTQCLNAIVEEACNCTTSTFGLPKGKQA